MSRHEPLDKQEAEDTTSHLLTIRIVCILGTVISLLEIAGGIYATQITGSGYENEWTIYLKLIPSISLICWIGFWRLRKASLVLLMLNIFFSMWVYHHVDGSLFNLSTVINIFFVFVMLGQLHKMTRFI